MKQLKNKYLKLFILIIAIFSLTGCVDENLQTFESTIEKGGAYRANLSTTKDKNESISNKDSVKIISTYNIESETVDFDKSVDLLETEIHKKKGYISSHKVTIDKNNKSNNKTIVMSIKIPQKEMINTLKFIKSTMLITLESSESINVTDVFYDVEADIESLNAQKNKLNELNDKATSVKDILLIEEKTHKVDNELNKLNKKLLEMNDKTTYANIDFKLKEVQKLSVDSDKSDGEKIINSLKTSLINIKNVIISIIVLITNNIAFIIIGYAMLKAYKKYVIPLIEKNKNKENNENDEDEINTEDEECYDDFYDE